MSRVYVVVKILGGDFRLGCIFYGRSKGPRKSQNACDSYGDGSNGYFLSSTVDKPFRIKVRSDEAYYATYSAKGS